LASKSAQMTLSELRGVAQRSATCLLCFERDPNVCHRSIVTQELNKDDLVTLDLYGDDPARYARHSEALKSRYSHQGAAAA
jgi:hypothetical protein